MEKTEERLATGKCPVPILFNIYTNDQHLHNITRSFMENTPYPKYLCVTLDRTLSYKQYIHNTEMKVAPRNNLLRKMSSSKWVTNASTITTTALALTYFVVEYGAPVWARSAHAYKLDSELNSACRAITGCLKP